MKIVTSNILHISEHIPPLPCCGELKGDLTLGVAQQKKKIGQSQGGNGGSYSLKEIRDFWVMWHDGQAQERQLDEKTRL